MARIIMNKRIRNFEYDVCLSFAGEDRNYVDEVAKTLKSQKIKVFYDLYEQSQLWGKDLYQRLDDVYSNHARYCVIFISKAYSERLWTKHELKSAQTRAFNENEEYILPARFDDTKIPGIRDTVAYIDLRKVNSSAFAEIIIEKINSNPQINIDFVLTNVGEGEKSSWYLKNSGDTVVDVVVTHRDQNGNFDKNVLKVSKLESDKLCKLDKWTHPLEFVASFKDKHGKEYSLTCKGHFNKLQNGNIFELPA